MAPRHLADPVEPLATGVGPHGHVHTTEPNDDIDEIHNRMPVVLELDDVEVWLDVDEHPTDERSHLLRPAPNWTLSHHAVGLELGNVKNDGAHLIEPFPDSL